jgi:RimJ/RimL family protein N-acetyltransferase
MAPTPVDRGSHAPLLRDVDEADLPIFFEHQRDEEAHRMAAFPPRDRDAFMAHWRDKVLANATGRRKTIVAGGEVAGYVTSWQQGDERLVAYWIGREHWGRGVATAALAEFVSEHETTRPLHAHVAAQNAGSIRVLEKVGFERVGAPVAGDDGVAEHLYRLDR